MPTTKSDRTYSFNIDHDFRPLNFDIQEFRSNKSQRLAFQKKMLRNLRKPLSGARISARMGLTFNQYSKWENGKVRLTWSDFCAICRTKKIDLRKILSKSYAFNFEDLDSNPDEFLKYAFSTYFFSDPKFMASYLGISPHKMRRWLKEPGGMAFQEILKIMIYRPQFFLQFLHQMELLEHFPEFYEDRTTIENLIEIESSLPFMSAVLCYFDTEDYRKQERHDSAQVAQALHLEMPQVDLAIQNLIRLKVASLENAKYIPLNLSLDLHGSSKMGQVLEFNYWVYRWLCHLQLKLEPTLRRIETDSVSAFRVFTVPEENISKVSEILRRTYHEIISLIKDSPPGNEKLRVFLFGHFGIEDSPKFDFKSDSNQGFRVENGR